MSNFVQDATAIGDGDLMRRKAFTTQQITLFYDAIVDFSFLV